MRLAAGGHAVGADHRASGGAITVRTSASSIVKITTKHARPRPSSTRCAAPRPPWPHCARERRRGAPLPRRRASAPTRSGPVGAVEPCPRPPGLSLRKAPFWTTAASDVLPAVYGYWSARHVEPAGARRLDERERVAHAAPVASARSPCGARSAPARPPPRRCGSPRAPRRAGPRPRCACAWRRARPSAPSSRASAMISSVRRSGRARRSGRSRGRRRPRPRPRAPRRACGPARRRSGARCAEPIAPCAERAVARSARPRCSSARASSTRAR